MRWRRCGPTVRWPAPRSAFSTTRSSSTAAGCPPGSLLRHNPCTHYDRRTDMADAFIIDACRTPRGIGKQGKGALAHLHPQHLGATVLKALVERNGFDTADVDDVVW